jgi:hypothetical protein
MRLGPSMAWLLAIAAVGCADEVGTGADDDDAADQPHVRWDFDGDGTADHALYTDEGGDILIHASVGGQEGARGGDPGWLHAVADYDGDGRSDPAWYDPWTGGWHILESSQDYAEREPLPVAGEAASWPVPADYDGDGRAEIAFFSNETGQIVQLDEETGLEQGFEADGEPVGSPDWLPAVADYDGDGKADLSWYVPTTGSWRVFPSSQGYAEREPEILGHALSVPVPADYDGDGGADMALFDRTTGELLILDPETGVAEPFGFDGSAMGMRHFLPAVADYDGDGKADPSWFVPSTQMWRVYESSNGYEERERLNLGAAMDVPVQAPQLLAKRGIEPVFFEDEEVVGTLGSVRGVSIDVDDHDQPHILGERQYAGLDAHHRIGGVWQGEEPLIHPDGAVGSPTLEIDEADRGWFSYTTFIANDTQATGEWVALMEDMATAPALSWEVMVPPYTGFSGYLSIDPYHPDHCWRMGGQPAPTYKYDADGNVSADITMSPGTSSETVGFEISAVNQGTEPGIWHAAHSVIYQAVRSGYVNSTMDEAIIWDDHLAVISVDSDQTRAYVGLDFRDPEVAYINTYHDGLVLNIWDGEGLVYPSNDVYVLDPAPASFGNGSERFGAQWTTAARGGAFICWTSADGWIQLKYISYEGEHAFGETLAVAPGQQCALATDHRGDLHMAFVNGTLRYRKIRTR